MDSADVPPNVNHLPGLQTLYCTLFGVATLFVVFRSYVRVAITKDWGWDDTTNIFAWLFLVADLILLQFMAKDGFGRHMYYVEQEPGGVDKAIWFFRLHLWWMFCNLICVVLTKISMSIFILRIKNTKQLRWFLGGLMALTTLATIPLVVIIHIPCVPLRKVWDPSVHGWCMPVSSATIVAYIQSGFSILVDLVMTASPYIILWKVNISLKKKMMIWGLMSLGLIATAADALRNVYTKEVEAPDTTYDLANLFIVTTIEMNVGVIAECIPACAPFFRPRNNFTKSPNSSRTNSSSTLSDLSYFISSRVSFLKVTNSIFGDSNRNTKSDLGPIETQRESVMPIVATDRFARPPTIEVDLGEPWRIGEIGGISRSTTLVDSDFASKVSEDGSWEDLFRF